MAYRDSSFTSANALSLNATKPTLTQVGDILYTYFFTDGGLNSGITLTPPTGWTLVPGSNQGANTGAPDGWSSWVYWKMAGPSEPATYTWTIGGIPATDISAYIVALSGRKASPPVISHGTVNTTGNATPVTVSDSGITPLNRDDVLVFAIGDITVGTDAWSFGTLTNYTRRQNTQNGFNVGVCYTRDDVAAAATGTISVTLTRNSGTGTSGWGMFVLSVPAATVAPTSNPTRRLFRGGNVKLVRLGRMPLAPLPDTTNISWIVPAEPLPRTKSLPTALLTDSSFFVQVLSQEVITVDKWVQPISQPYLKTAYRQTGGEARFEVPRTILVTDWFQLASEPVRRKPTQLLGGEFRFELPRAILVTDWFQEASQPYFSKRRDTNFGEYRFEVPRAILLSDWFQPTSVPYFSKLRNSNFGEYRFELPRTILVTDWFQPLSAPYFTKRRDANTGEYRFELPREILLSDWFNETSQPVQKLIRQLLGGEVRIDVLTPAEIITLDKWYNDTSQPYFNRKTNSNFGEYRFEVPREILLSDWFHDTSQPVKDKVRQLLGGAVSIEIIIPPEVITLDKWYQETQQPYFTRLTQTDQYEFRVDVVETPPPTGTVPYQFVEIINEPEGGSHNERRRQEEQQNINEILKDDEAIRFILKKWLNHFN